MYDYKKDIIFDHRDALPALKEKLEKLESVDLLKLSKLLMEYHGKYYPYDAEEGLEYLITQNLEEKWEIIKSGKYVKHKTETPITIESRSIAEAFVFICKNKLDERLGDEDYWLNLEDYILELQEIRNILDESREFLNDLEEYSNKSVVYNGLFAKVKQPEAYDYVENEDGTYALRILGIPLYGLDRIPNRKIAKKLYIDIFWWQFGKVG